MKKELEKIINCSMFILQKVAEIQEYHWNKDFKLEQIKEAYEKIQEELKNVDFSKLTRKELKIARFGHWDKDVWLCPLYLQKILKPKAKDNDTRFGCIADGWKMKNGKLDFKSKAGIS